jgi:hypothetical protein
MQNTEVILMGNINVDLRKSDRSPRDTKIMTTLANFGLFDMCNNFLQQWKHCHGWTWKSRRDGRVLKSCCDVMLGTDRCHFRAVTISDPPGFDSNHFAIIATIIAAPLAEHRAYLRGCKQQPTTHDSMLMTNIADAHFWTLAGYCEKKVAKHWTDRADWISDRTWKLMNK